MHKQVILYILFFPVISTVAQVTQPGNLTRMIKEKDSLLFTVGFNSCDIRQFEALISEQFEFYHDQAGITRNKSAFIEGTRNGLCTLPYKPIRKPEEGSMEVYPLMENGVVYGAIQTGVHRFYARENDHSEYLTSIARYTHVWILENGEWRLTKGLSYDHKVFGKPAED